MQSSWVHVSYAVLGALLVALAGADVQSDVAQQIAAANAKINHDLANVQSSIANAPAGSVSISAGCATDSSGNSNCVKNVSSATGAGTVSTESHSAGTPVQVSGGQPSGPAVVAVVRTDAQAPTGTAAPASRPFAWSAVTALALVVSARFL